MRWGGLCRRDTGCVVCYARLHWVLFFCPRRFPTYGFGGNDASFLGVLSAGIRMAGGGVFCPEFG